MFEVCVKGKDEQTDNEIKQQDICKAGVMPQEGDLYFHAIKCGNKWVGLDKDGQGSCEIEDGDELILAKGTASEILLSDKEVYKGLRDKFVITIEVIPEDMTVYENAVNIKFEDKHKYYERMQARYGRV